MIPSQTKEPNMGDPTAADLALARRNIRALQKEITKEADKKIADLDKHLITIDTALLTMFKNIGADSIKTQNGLIMRGTVTKYWTSNWNALYNLIAEHRAFHLLEKRISQSSIAEFLKDNPEFLPDGLNISKEYKITVRKPEEN